MSDSPNPPPQPPAQRPPIRPTHECLHIRSTRDAMIVFEAVRLGILPLIRRRLTTRECHEFVKEGAVFVWEECDFIDSADGAGSFQRWTDKVSWSQSSVQGPFLVYEEKADVPSGAEKLDPALHAKSKTRPNKPGGLTKQTFSAIVLNGPIRARKGPLKWHMTAYFRRPDQSLLPSVDDDPKLQDIVVEPDTFKMKPLRGGLSNVYKF